MRKAQGLSIEGPISIRVEVSPLTESADRLPRIFLMDYLRNGPREESSDHRPFLKSYIIAKDLGSGRKLGEGQGSGKDLEAVRIGKMGGN